MFRMKNKLNNLYNANKEVKFAIVGAGKMGKGLVNQLSRIKGLTSSVVIDEKPEKAMEALISSGVRKSDITTSDNIKIIENSIKNGMYVVSDDYSIACKLQDIKGIVDATGNPPFGAILATETIENRKHMIMLNVECDAVIGPYLYNLAKKKM
ncbi:dihydrodipicolinate reductase, N-terminal domain protein [Parvimonas sp. oral taxon 393 str. F0440]|nr:dihydrodipicolinate reductase, N-terminal domain protein [Parvimonas sp. oral taxon 393 str. F0440]